MTMVIFNGMKDARTEDGKDSNDDSDKERRG